MESFSKTLENRKGFLINLPLKRMLNKPEHSIQRAFELLSFNHFGVPNPQRLEVALC